VPIAASAGDIAEIIRALAALAWPVVLGGFLWFFRDQLRSLVGRLREASVPGGDFKFDPELDRLADSAQAALEAVSEGAPADAEESEVDPVVREALETAAQSPRAALILLAAELERRVRQLAAQRGQLYANPQVWRNRPVTANTLRLFELPPPVLEAVDEFRHVRNRVVHGQGATDPEVLRAIDSAVMILEALDRVPRELNEVYATEIPVYSDAEAQDQREQVKGVMLRTTSTEQPDKVTLRIFPTTRTHFREGELVAWEWNMSMVWGESWYRHPDTGEIEYGWTSSGEFVGSHLADV
jgi:hypothetical protein